MATFDTFHGEPLLPDGDYILRDGAAWFSVGGFALRVTTHNYEDPGSLRVWVCPLGTQGEVMGDPIGELVVDVCQQGSPIVIDRTDQSL